MASVIKAGNATNGIQITSDSTGILEIRTGTGAGTTALTIGTDQSVNFSGTAQRITGDFSNATIANRVMFQTSTANSATIVEFLPSGSGTISGVNFGSSSDLANTSILSVSSLSTDARFNAGARGTGSNLPMTFYTGGSETARFSATAKTLILSGGDTTANGTGITFPATQSASSNANTLDDYEETTFTPSFAYTTPGTSSFTYANRSGTCRKIGAFVFATGYIQLSAFSKGTASGQLIITGFPFTSSVNSVGSVNLYDYPLPAGSNSIGLLMEGNQPYCFLFGNGSNTLHPTPDPDGNSQIWFAVCYATST